jgi:hypothetical protein
LTTTNNLLKYHPAIDSVIANKLQIWDIKGGKPTFKDEGNIFLANTVKFSCRYTTRVYTSVPPLSKQPAKGVQRGISSLSVMRLQMLASNFSTNHSQRK